MGRHWLQLSRPLASLRPMPLPELSLRRGQHRPFWREWPPEYPWSIRASQLVAQELQRQALDWRLQRPQVVQERQAWLVFLPELQRPRQLSAPEFWPKCLRWMASFRPWHCQSAVFKSVRCDAQNTVGIKNSRGKQELKTDQSAGKQNPRAHCLPFSGCRILASLWQSDNSNAQIGVAFLRTKNAASGYAHASSDRARHVTILRALAA